MDIILGDLSAPLRERHGASFAPSTISRFLDRHGMTLKKTAHASEQERPDVAARQQVWLDAQPDLNPTHLVVIDENGAFIDILNRIPDEANQMRARPADFIARLNNRRDRSPFRIGAVACIAQPFQIMSQPGDFESRPRGSPLSRKRRKSQPAEIIHLDFQSERV